MTAGSGKPLIENSVKDFPRRAVKGTVHWPFRVPVSMHHPPGSSRFIADAYHRYGDELRRYLSRRLHNEQDARELAQEVWTRLLRVRDGAEIMEPLAYIYRTAANVIVEFRMRRRRERVYFDSATSEHFSEHPHPGAREDEMAERLNRQKQLEQTLARLPKVYRNILILKVTQELTYQQIGEQLGLSAKTVEQYFFRAMALVKTRTSP